MVSTPPCSVEFETTVTTAPSCEYSMQRVLVRRSTALTDLSIEHAFEKAYKFVSKVQVEEHFAICQLDAYILLPFKAFSVICSVIKMSCLIGYPYRKLFLESCPTPPSTIKDKAFHRTAWQSWKGMKIRDSTVVIQWRQREVIKALSRPNAGQYNSLKSNIYC